MFKMEISAKALKKEIVKVQTVISKRSAFKIYEAVCLRVFNEGLFLSSTDGSISLRVGDVGVINAENGTIVLENADIKLLTKMSGFLTIEETSSGVKVMNGKKTLTLHSLPVDTFPEFPKFLDDSEKVGIIELHDFQDGIEKLKTFVSNNDENKVMSCYNLNWRDSTIYALDGYRIGWKKLETSETAPISTYLIENEAQTIFKKLSNDSHGENMMNCYESSEYIRIEGEGFTYVQRKIDGKYFDVDKMIINDTNTEIILDREDLLKVSKYNCELAKSDKNNLTPMVVYIDKNNQLHSYFENSRVESVDELETTSIKLHDDYIGFNPEFLRDMANVAETEDLEIRGKGPKNPWIIAAGNYGFLILPTCIGDKRMKRVEELKSLA